MTRSKKPFIAPCKFKEGDAVKIKCRNGDLVGHIIRTDGTFLYKGQPNYYVKWKMTRYNSLLDGSICHEDDLEFAEPFRELVYNASQAGYNE